MFVTVDGIARHLQVAVCQGRETLVHLFYFECIGERNGIEYGFKVVVAVGAFGYDVESKVNFTTRESNHSENVLVALCELLFTTKLRQKLLSAKRF